MTHLSRQMREALIAAKRFNGLRRTWRHDTPGQPEWPASPASLAALVRRELMARREDRNRQGDRYVAWELTDAGRRALEPPTKVIRHKTRLLARTPQQIPEGAPPGASSYTGDPARAVRGAGEPMDDPDVGWARSARERHVDADRKAEARRVRQQARRAA